MIQIDPIHSVKLQTTLNSLNNDLSQSVEESLKEAEQSLRNALAFAARQERPMVCSVIAELIARIDSMKSTDEILDKLESREEGSSGSWGQFFTDD